MNKTKLLVLLVITLLVVSGIAVAQGNANRYLVKSHNPALKAMFGVQHNFKTGFTTDLTQGQVKALEKLGMEVEKVALYHILGKPVCGDNEIHKREQCGEPELPDCPEGYVCENCKCVEESAPPERPCYPVEAKPWGIIKVNGSSGGGNVNVAVLDTGVYKDHLDLKANIIDCQDATKRGIKKGCADRHGHGTHVAGTVAANGGDDGEGIFGVAPEANLWAIKVCGNSGWCHGDDMAAGIEYAADRGAHIISMSIGGDSEDPLVKDAIDYAVGEGVLVIAAAGNSGPADGSIEYPGANAKVIAVGAIDSNESVASWSSRGINDGDYIIEEREVEFGAPGVAVESTFKDGCYVTWQGTSMATPHVAGLAAKLWKGDAATTRSYLQSIAKDIWITEDDPETPDIDERDDTATGFGLPVAP